MYRPSQQIRIESEGIWHRRLEGNGMNETVCGIKFLDIVPATREFRLDDKICETCHVDREIRTGKMKALEKEEEKYRDDEEYEPLMRSSRGTRRDTLRDITPFRPNPDDDKDDK